MNLLQFENGSEAIALEGFCSLLFRFQKDSFCASAGDTWPQWFCLCQEVRGFEGWVFSHLASAILALSENYPTGCSPKSCPSKANQHRAMWSSLVMWHMAKLCSFWCQTKTIQKPIGANFNFRLPRLNLAWHLPLKWTCGKCGQSTNLSWSLLTYNTSRCR